MRILFLSHYYPPEVNAPASRTSEHCARWAAAGHDITVVTCVPNCPDGVVFGGYRNQWRHQEEIIDGVRVIRTWTYVAANAGVLRRVLNYLSYMLSAIWVCRRLPRPDVVVATSPQFFCGWAGVWVSRFKRCPFVLEIRDIWPESIAVVGVMRRGTMLKILEWLERRMYAAADHIVTVGEGYRERILEKCNRPVSNTVIMNGVDLDQFNPDIVGASDTLRSQWNLDGRFVCSYVGTIGMAHGLEVVLNAAEILNQQGRTDVVFLLVGDGAQRQALESNARRRNLSSTVIFTGRQPRSFVPATLSASDACLVHLRATELFGTVVPSKIFETMAMERPIIMGVTGLARDLVIEANAGVPMCPESAEDLVAAIDQLAGDADLCRGMGAAGRAFVAEHFSRDKLAETYLSLLADICGASREEVPPSPAAPAVIGAADRTA